VRRTRRRLRRKAGARRTNAPRSNTGEKRPRGAKTAPSPSTPSCRSPIGSKRAKDISTFEAFFAAHPDRLEWQAPVGGCVSFPRYLGGDGVENFCTELVEQEGVVLLPASIYRSALGPDPTDRFRIGVGRRDPEPALEAFCRFLDSHVSVRR
jgi:hypothetical protein